jgi:CysZ protein
MSLRIEILTQTVLRAARDLTRPALLFQVIWPPLAAFVLWSVVAWFAWLPAADWVVTQLPDWSWLNWFGPWLAHLAVFLVFAPLIYVTALLFIAAFALPRMMAIVAARDYPQLSRQGSPQAALWGSLWNTLAAGAIFVIGWLVSLPLLLIPGALFVLPLFWSAWLNQRAFRFDALAEHALPLEREAIFRRERGNLFGAGLLSAVVGYVPVIHLLAPGFAALLFVHLCLAALRELRNQEGITL